MLLSGAGDRRQLAVWPWRQQSQENDRWQLADWPWRKQSQENDRRYLEEQPWRWQSMLEDRIQLCRWSGRLGPKANLLVYEVVQGGHHEERLLLQENIMRNKQERTKEFKQWAGPSIWHRNTPKYGQKQQSKKVARNGSTTEIGKAAGKMTWRLLTRCLEGMRWRSSRRLWKLSGFSGRLITHLTRFTNTLLTAQRTCESAGPLIPAAVRRWTWKCPVMNWQENKTVDWVSTAHHTSE